MAHRFRSDEVLLDVCTQRDYLHADGARPVANLAELRRNVKQLMAYARWTKIPTLSCIEGRRPKDVAGVHHPDCVLGTSGQRKALFTLMPDHVFVDTDNCPAISLEILHAHQQAVLLKGDRDPFGNPKLDRLLTEMAGKRFVIFGVSLEGTIRMLTLGLLLRHRDVTVIRDACGYWDADEADMVLRQLDVKDCQLVTTREFLHRRIAQRLNGSARPSRFVA